MSRGAAVQGEGERAMSSVGTAAPRDPWGSASLAVALPVLKRPRLQGCCCSRIQPVLQTAWSAAAWRGLFTPLCSGPILN